MDTATTVDKEALTRGTWFTAVQAGIQHNARARVTKDQPVKWDVDCEAVV